MEIYTGAIMRYHVLAVKMLEDTQFKSSMYLAEKFIKENKGVIDRHQLVVEALYSYRKKDLASMERAMENRAFLEMSVPIAWNLYKNLVKNIEGFERRAAYINIKERYTRFHQEMVAMLLKNRGPVNGTNEESRLVCGYETGRFGSIHLEFSLENAEEQGAEEGLALRVFDMRPVNAAKKREQGPIAHRLRSKTSTTAGNQLNNKRIKLESPQMKSEENEQPSADVNIGDRDEADEVGADNYNVETHYLKTGDEKRLEESYRLMKRMLRGLHPHISKAEQFFEKLGASKLTQREVILMTWLAIEKGDLPKLVELIENHAYPLAYHKKLVKGYDFCSKQYARRTGVIESPVRILIATQEQKMGSGIENLRRVALKNRINGNTSMEFLRLVTAMSPAQKRWLKADKDDNKKLGEEVEQFMQEMNENEPYEAEDMEQPAQLEVIGENGNQGVRNHEEMIENGDENEANVEGINFNDVRHDEEQDEHMEQPAVKESKKVVFKNEVEVYELI